MAALSPSARRLWAAGPAKRKPMALRPQALRADFHLESGMTVGVLGGSFNPAHAGHAHVAETALARLKLDRVLWLVTPQNPLKDAAHARPLAERMASAKSFALGPRMIVSDFETRIGSRYTYDALLALQARYPAVRFVWIMGGDNLAGFHKWRGWIDILRRFPVAVISRPGSMLSSRFAPAARRFAHARLSAEAAPTLAYAPIPAWTYLTGPFDPTSSTALRATRPDAPQR